MSADEHFYRKYISGKAVYPFEIRITSDDFDKKISPAMRNYELS
jgi:hypothetical protein